jgi:hypothetical protein
VSKCTHEERYLRHRDDRSELWLYCTVCEIERLREELRETKLQLRLMESEVAKLQGLEGVDDENDL